MRSLPCYACISQSVSLTIARNQMERLLTLWCLHRVSCQSNNNYYAAVLNKNMQYGYSSLTECNFHILLNALVQYETCQISEERIPEQSLFQHTQCSNNSCLKNKKIVDIKKKTIYLVHDSSQYYSYRHC